MYLRPLLRLEHLAVLKIVLTYVDFYAFQPDYHPPYYRSVVYFSFKSVHTSSEQHTHTLAAFPSSVNTCNDRSKHSVMHGSMAFLLQSYIHLSSRVQTGQDNACQWQTLGSPW